MDNSHQKPEVNPRPGSIAGSSHTIDSGDTLQGTLLSIADQTSTPHGSPVLSAKIDVPVANFKPEKDVEKAPDTPRGGTEEQAFAGEDENPAIRVSFQGPSSPALQKNKDAGYVKTEDGGINRMHKFSLYETSTRFFLVGADSMDKHYRVLKIDRTAPPGHLSITDDDIVYDKRHINQLLSTIDDGNKHTGGIKLKCSAWGLLGFVRFTEAYYMLLITKRAQVAMIGGHYIYQVDGTELIPLTTGTTARFQKDRNPEEARFLGILNSIDLTRFFYFSYSYNITRCLQQNIVRERQALNERLPHPNRDYQDMFVWNHFLLDPAKAALKNVYDWCHPIIHGSVDQSSLDVFGRRIYITLIARRSRYFAGARFLKRGLNDRGYVANDVETEQIVSEALTTSFHAPGPRLFSNPGYTSYVQHRGSIPIHWSQENNGVTPKPDIDLNFPDPFFSATALHFDHMFERYGAPVYVLNLIKQRERTPRESKLLHEYKHALEYLNQSLPKDKRIIYEAFDMSRASKTRGQDVIGTLEGLAEKVIRQTGFFHNGDTEFDSPQVQNGVARTNCIDCLDRTNAAQFVIAKRALGRQLQALGVIKGTTVEYDTDCVDNFTHMFHNHGDAIAMQYGGSHLVNTMATYRKINQWQSSSRDMVESVKRYYHNSFLDNQRQEAYNLFLGKYIFEWDGPLLWELGTDHSLHYDDPRFFMERYQRSYINWYTPENLEPRSLPPLMVSSGRQIQSMGTGVHTEDDYWVEYYRPLALTSFVKVYAWRLSNPPGHQKDISFPSRQQDPSPFVVRKKQQDHPSVPSPEKRERKASRKGVTILDPRSDGIIAKRRKDIHLNIPDRRTPVKQSILRETYFETRLPTSAPATAGTFPSLGNFTSTQRSFKPADKNLVHQWTLTQFHENSMNPHVTAVEEDEYSRYIEHPLNLPLVVSSEMPLADDPCAQEFIEYLDMTEGGAGGASQPQPLRDSGGSYFPQAPMSEYSYADSDAVSVRSYGARPTSSASYPFTPFSHPSANASHYTLPSSQHYNTPHPNYAHHFQAQYPSSDHHSPQYPHSIKEEGGLEEQYQQQSQPSSTPGLGKFQTTDEDIEEFGEFLKVKDNPLDVEVDDGRTKRYKAYRQWLRGKSFFKQSKVDPEWENQLPVR